MYTINDLANYYCYHYQMSYKKLQSILYYTYAWSMVLSKDQKPLFKAHFIARTHGPRDLSLIDLNQQFGYQYIEIDTDPKIKFNKDHKDLIDQIVQVYVQPYSGLKLDTLTTQETPWLNGKNRSAKIITDDDIIAFYRPFLDEKE